MIKIQKKSFNIDKEITTIKNKHKDVGAVSIFIGYVRDINQNKKVKSIDLEVYSEMAYKYLDDLTYKVKKKWDLSDILIIHRFGKLKVNEKIVLVAVLSMHRESGIKACTYIMDYLKKKAPFWKKEEYPNKKNWI